MHSFINIKIHNTSDPSTLLPVARQLPVQLPTRVRHEVLYLLQVPAFAAGLLASEQSATRYRLRPLESIQIRL